MHVEFTSLFEAQRAPHANAQMFPTTALLRHAVLLEDAEIDRLLIEKSCAYRERQRRIRGY